MSIAPVDDILYTRLGNFLQIVLGVVPVIRGLDNRVPMPDAPFAAMTPVGNDRIWMIANGDNYTRPAPLPAPNNGTRNFEHHIGYRVQLDFYGPASRDWAAQVFTLITSDYGVEKLAPEVSPLQCTEPLQLPLVNGEEQFEQRWSFTASLQYNSVVSVPQEFAEQLEIGLIEVDSTYPPGA